MGNMKDELKSIFTEHWKYLAVNTACELEIFDKIFEGQNSSDKLIQNNQWNLKTLSHLLGFLITNEYLIEGENQTFNLSPKANLLRKNNPDGLYYACLNWSGEHLLAWQNLKYSIETGKSSFEHVYKKPYFDYLNDHPEKLMKYHKAMYEYARDDYKNLPKDVNFGIHRSIMDVGGGYGAAIELIASTYPDLECFLFDLETVLLKTSIKGVKNISGDFFKSIPTISEAIILSRVLHDWNNEKASVILQNCFEALPSNGTLYVIENCIDLIQSDLSLLSLNMTAMCESFERSKSQYIELCKNSGFKFNTHKKLNNLQSILIFTK